jgi:hypothetical protein
VFESIIALQLSLAAAPFVVPSASIGNKSHERMFTPVRWSAKPNYPSRGHGSQSDRKDRAAVRVLHDSFTPHLIPR